MLPFKSSFRQAVGRDLCQIVLDHEQGGANLRTVVTNLFAKHKIVSWMGEAVRGLQRPELFQKAWIHVLPGPDGIEHLIARARQFHGLGLWFNKVYLGIIPENPPDDHEAAMAEPDDEWLLIKEEPEEEASLAPIEPAPSVGPETEAAATARVGPKTEADAAVSGGQKHRRLRHGSLGRPVYSLPFASLADCFRPISSD